MAVVTVAYPATPLTLGRARFCVSAAHSKAMIDQAVDAIDLLGDQMNLKYTLGHLQDQPDQPDLYDNLPVHL